MAARLFLMLLGWSLPWLAVHASAADAARTAKMIADLGLIEAPQPVRSSPQWSKPRRVIVRDAPPARLKWLQTAAPGVQLVSAANSSEATSLARNADAVVGFCDAEILKAGTKIQWIQVFTAGVENCVSVPQLRERRVLLTNMQKVAGPAMAEHVMAMVLSFARGLPFYAEGQRKGEWRSDGSASARPFTLEGKTMFVAGLGGIGTEVAERAHALGMKVIATRASKRPAPSFVSRVGTPDQLLAMTREADVVVNALPLTAETRDLFNARVFAGMKPTAYFINVGRGATVVTADLVNALQKRALAGAGLDVTAPEPLPKGHPLWKLPNVIITPHVASDAEDDMENRWLLVRENLRRYVAGEKMLSVVDTARGY